MTSASTTRGTALGTAPRRGLRVDLTGRLIDRWLGLPPARTHDVRVARDLPVPMSDGVVLLANRYRPPGEIPMPVVLIRSPYGREAPYTSLFVGPLARRGLQVVLQSSRGTFGSGGEFHPFRDEQADGLDTLAWLRAQPWCDGRVAMAGVSYLGYTQWALAPYADPPLSAIAPACTGSRLNLARLAGGTFPLFTALSWAALLGRQEHAPFIGLLPNPLRGHRERRAMRCVPLLHADIDAAGRPVQAWYDLINHTGPDDGYWSRADHSRAITTLRIPVSMVSGWYDPFLPEQMNDFRNLATAGCPVRITIGPWGHDDAAVARAVAIDQVDWLTRHLGDHGTGDRHTDTDTAPVRVFLQQAEQWLRFGQWPPRSCRPTPVYLRSDGCLGWQPPGTGTPDRFVYDPHDPTPAVGGAVITGRNKQRDNRALEARADVLVYTSSPLPHDLDLVGDVSAVIYTHAEPAYADLFVRLCDVNPAGVSRNVCDGILRMRPGEPPADTDGAVAAEITLWPTAYRFRRGHRLRVQVSGGAFPRYPRNHGTGAMVGTAVRSRSVQIHIRHDPSHPSRILLPCLSGS